MIACTIALNENVHNLSYFLIYYYYYYLFYFFWGTYYLPRSQHPKTQAPHIEYGSKRDLSHCGLAIYIKKYFKAKEELWKKTQIYFTMQKYNLKKKSL
jgi:hypothetical protein